MKKNISLFIIFLSFCSTVFSQETSFSFNLDGKVENTKAKQLILTYIDNGVKIQKTADIEDGKFSVSGNISEPKWVRLKMGEVSTSSFWLEGGNISLSFSASEPDKLDIQGSKLNEQYNIVMSEVRELSVKQDSIQRVWQTVTKQLEAEKDFNRIESLKMEQEQVKQAFDSIFKKHQTYYLFRVNSYPDSFLNAKALANFFPMFYRRWISAEEGLRIYNGLSSDMKNTPTGKIVKQLIENYANTEEGKLAPDFEVEDIHGDTVRLSDFRHKNVVLIDGWASWCRPCLEKIPLVNELYQQYKDKGFVVIGISKDENVEQWKQAIIKHKTEDWIHILAEKEYMSWINKGFSEGDILLKYPLIESIPRYFLINKDGIVIGSWQNYSDEISQKIQQVLAN